MEWWNDLWLNEGFAKFMEFISVDATYPELQVVSLLSPSLQLGSERMMLVKSGINVLHALICVLQDDFFLGKCFEAMEVDSLSSSHPVSTHVENPTQIQEMFDDVSYDKVSGSLPVSHWIDAPGPTECSCLCVASRERAS